MGSEGFLTVSPQNGNFVVPGLANMKYEVEFSSGNEFLENQGKDLSDNVPGGKDKSCPEIEEGMCMPLEPRTEKASRTGGSCSKRSRMSESEHSTSLNELEESKGISEKLGSHHVKKKSQFPKQKSNSIKHGEKRNFKVPFSMAKYDPYCLKLGASIFGSAYERNNFFVNYGLKHDIQDVTKLMDVPSLDELLRDTFDCPNFSKDKKKLMSNTSVNFLNSIRKACSLLQLPKSVQSQNIAEIDSSFYKKISSSQMSSVCVVESISNGDKEQSFASDMSASHKDLCTENECPSNPLDFPLYQPKNVLERISLPPSQDLESLLLDMSKLGVPAKNSNNLRPGKQVSRQPNLPTFPWSHAFGTHSRINSDSVKLSTNRSTCQGKWARIAVISRSTDIDHGCFTNLDSFSYYQSLVPSTGSSNDKVCPSSFANDSLCQWNSSSPATHSNNSKASAAGAHCPGLLEAAQTLCEIASYSPGRNSYGIIRLQKKTSHKAMKGKNIKPTVKLEEMPSTPTCVVGSNQVRSVDRIIPSKKPRVSVVENKKDVHSTNAKKRPCTRPSSKSCIPLPSKPGRDLIKQNKNSAASILKELTMMHPADRIFKKGKAYVGQYKVRKLETGKG